jgi:hypothetical protein
VTSDAVSVRGATILYVSGVPGITNTHNQPPTHTTRPTFTTTAPDHHLGARPASPCLLPVASVSARCCCGRPSSRWLTAQQQLHGGRRPAVRASTSARHLVRSRGAPQDDCSSCPSALHSARPCPNTPHAGARVQQASTSRGAQQQQTRHASAHPEATVYSGPQSPRKAVTLRTLRSKYEKGQPITMVTAYDYPSAVHVSRLWQLRTSLANATSAVHGCCLAVCTACALTACLVHPLCCCVTRTPPGPQLPH